MFPLAQEQTVVQIFNYADKLGVVVVLLIILLGGVRKWWVFGWVHQAEVERNKQLEDAIDAWRETAFKATGVADDAFSELRRRPR